MELARYRKTWVVVVIFLLVLCALYSAGGALQGTMLFTGNKAVLNWNRWGASTIVFVALAIVLFARSARYALTRQMASLLCVTAVVLSLYSFFGVIEREIRVDSCLDRGDTFNYAKDACGTEDANGSLTFFDYQGAQTTFAVVLFVFAISATRKLKLNQPTSKD